jgi:hypothetical protein
LQPLLPWLKEIDAGGVALKPGLKKAVEAVQQGINQSKQFLDPTNDDQKMAIKMIEAFGNWMASVDENVNYFAMGARLDNGGNVTLGFRGGFVKDGSFARSAGAFATAKGNPLAGLPGGPFMTAFGMVMPENYADQITAFVEFAIDPGKSKLTAAEKSEFLGLVKGMSNFESAAIVFGASPEGPGAFMSNFVAVYKVADTKKYLANYEKNAKRYNELAKKLDPDNDNTKLVSTETVKVDGITVVEVVQKFEAKTPQEQQIMEALFGKTDRIYTSMAVVDSKTLLIALSAAKDMPKRIKAYKAKTTTLATQDDVKKVTAKMPKGALTIWLFNPQYLPPLMEPFVKQVDPTIPKLPMFPDSPPAGFGMRLSSSGVEAEIVVPIPLIENTATYFRKLMALRGV